MKPIQILILTANPKTVGYSPLRVDAEVRLVEDSIQRSQYRDRFQLTTRLAIRTTDLRRALTATPQPQIVHFSGHGTGEKGLVLETDAGKAAAVSIEALIQLFGAFETNDIECVLLNACYSDVQATAIHQFVDCVIGMNQPIGDEAALQFAEGFYDALGAGRPYDEAFKIGCSAIALSGSSEASIPTIKYRKRRGTTAPAYQNGSESSTTHNAAPSTFASPQSVSPQSASPIGQSQTIGSITISGNSNAFSNVQAGGDVTLNQSQTQTRPITNPDVGAAIEALGSLKKAIAADTTIDDMEKDMVSLPIQKLEEELKKPQPNRSKVENMMAKLKKFLDGAVSIADPLAKLGTIVTKVLAGLS